MRSNDVTANVLANVVGLPGCPLNATRTLRMIENLIHFFMWFITDAYSSFIFFKIFSANRLWYAVACAERFLDTAVRAGLAAVLAVLIGFTSLQGLPCALVMRAHNPNTGKYP